MQVEKAKVEQQNASLQVELEQLRARVSAMCVTED